MKKETLQDRADIVNNSLYYIYKNIESNITLDDVARDNSVSKYHFYRIFKEETGENFSQTITSIRLQKAANLLISNKYSTITEISKLCGYSSHSSFIKAFKKKYHYSPKEYRNNGYIKLSKQIIPKEYYKPLNLEAQIKVTEEITCAYIRHKGYNKDIKYTWEKLRALAYELDIKDYKEIGLHHDNPSITTLDECKYVAAVTIPKDLKIKHRISTFKIPKSLCAIFKYQGQYGEIINMIRYINQEWIKDKGYEITTLPTYIIYEDNHLIEEDKLFKIEVRVPIKVI